MKYLVHENEPHEITLYLPTVSTMSIKGNVERQMTLIIIMNSEWLNPVNMKQCIPTANE